MAYNFSTVALNSPSNGATGVSTTPALTFTGTDVDGDYITYEVEVATSSSFGTEFIIDKYNANSSLYATIGGWTDFSSGNVGYLDSVDYVINGYGSATATWDFGLLNGKYRVDIFWGVATVTYRADDAPFTIKGFSDKSGTPDTGGTVWNVADETDEYGNFDPSAITFDITQYRNDHAVVAADDNYPSGWVNLGTYTMDNGYLTVVLTDNADNYVIADAVRITPIPLLGAISSSDSGFSGSPVNTGPFPSAQAVTYTVPSALSASTTYYWRVRGRDNDDTNNFGDWSTTRSFTTAGGGGAVSATVTQLAANVTATGGTQTVAAARKIAIAQVAATVTAAGGTQAVTTVRNVSISQIAANITAAGGTQAVAATTSTSIAQLAASITAGGGTQVIASSQLGVIAQVAANVTATGGTQAVSAAISASISQLAATITASGGTQTVTAGAVGSITITQVAASVTAAGGTQAIATVNNVTVAQIAANVTASGGTQSVATVRNATVVQPAAAVTATGGTHSLAAMISIAVAQQAASVLASGGTQVLYADSGATNIAVSQLAANLLASGGTQVISTATGPVNHYPKMIYDIDGNPLRRVTARKYMRI